jgi:uncharacterized protein YkwD
MTEQQDVLDPRRPRRRRTPVILLGILPVAIAATVLVAGPQYVTPTKTSTDATGAHAVVANRAQITPGVVAPGSVTKVDLKSSVQKITVTLPKPKVVAPPARIVPVSVSVSGSVRHSNATEAAVYRQATTTTATVVKTSSITYRQFCSNPSNPVSTSGTTGKSLLYMVNKERAKIGIRAMSWSSSMASTATSWSKTMLARDMKTSTLIDGLSHNPNRPGAENVAVVYRSTGYAASTAISKMHKNLVYSQGHCLNLMNPTYRYMGSGIAHSTNNRTWYATENFR